MKLLYGTAVIVLFGTLALGYSLVSTSIPVTVAQAQAAVIEARSQSRIDEMYAANNIALMTQARERNETTAQIILGVTVGALAVIVMLAVVILGAASWQRVHRIGGVKGTRMIDGELWHVVGQSGEWVKLERISQYELAERRVRR